ncbi:hypothetical protein [Paenibacillus gallinarum]|uniref:Bacterial Pleckstrin homology domain-containing protein n=1 Tax=Paenibacillus gallinarum TaxID=2762232 RepID=A0ABR8SY18_9BACL|nr:hypothetical protein [Paenibacillus gallinarum]MBD7968406.1 hypothetical protein [Paenibacillus gallinarum]
MSNPIAIQPYYKMERKIHSLDMEIIEHQRLLKLYPDKIVSAYREFPIEKVFDLSYRSMGSGHGMLYIHTQQGVYPYTLRENPKSFILAVKQFI